MIILETENLILYPLTMEFCTQNYVDWLNDIEVYKYLETRGQQNLQTLENFIQKQMDEKTNIWAIVIKETNKHIGNIKIDQINHNHGYAEFSILIGDKNEWGKSYASEASRKVINYFFNEYLLLRKINLGVVISNIKATKLYEKIGFQTEGVFKNHLLIDGNYYDSIRMAIFNPKFKYE